MTRRHALRAVIGAAVIAAGGLLFTPAAQAAAHCDWNNVCLYQNPGFTGSASIQARLSPGSSGYVGSINNFQNSHYTDGETLNDSVSSVHNYTFKWVELCADANYSGSYSFWGTDKCTLMAPNSDASDLRNFFSGYGPDNRNFNDIASSIKMFDSYPG